MARVFVVAKSAEAPMSDLRTPQANAVRTGGNGRIRRALAGVGCLWLGAALVYVAYPLVTAPDPVPEVAELTPVAPDPAPAPGTDLISTERAALAPARTPVLSDKPLTDADVLSTEEILDLIESPAFEEGDTGFEALVAAANADRQGAGSGVIAPCVLSMAALAETIVLPFPADTAEVDPASLTPALALAAAAAECPEARVIVEGHTDSSGEQADNLVLSWARADAVIAQMQSLGADTRKFEALGYGDRRPLAQGDGIEDDPENRRVEFRVEKIVR